MKRRKKLVDTSEEVEEYLIPYETKLSIFALFLILLSILGAWCIFSYSSHDDVLLESISVMDLVKLLDKNSDVSILTSKIKNPLGIIGAFLANLLVVKFIGYFSLLLMIIICYWGIIIFSRIKDYRKIVFHSILILDIALLLSSITSIVLDGLGLLKENFQVTGKVGILLGQVTIKLLGSVGSIILIVFLIVVLFSVLFNYDLREPINLMIFTLKSLYQKWKEKNKIKINRKTSKISSIPKVKTRPSDIKVNEKPASVLLNISNGFTNDKQEERMMEVSLEKEDLSREKVKNEKNRVEETKEIKEEEGYEPWDASLPFEFPSVDLLENQIHFDLSDQEEFERKASIIEQKLKIFNINIKQILITPGPVVTLFEIIPEDNVKVSEIKNKVEDLALALNARGIRLIAPMPGRGTIGIELANDRIETIRAKTVLGSKEYQQTNFTLPLAFGKTSVGNVFIEDLASMPHLLIAGSTGSGKSVGVNMIINSLIFKLHPSKIKFILIDLKRIELTHYAGLLNHYLAVCPDVKDPIITTSQDAVTVLQSLEIEMERRYDLISKAMARNINDYNEKYFKNEIPLSDEVEFKPLPYLVLIIDEFADLMITEGRNVETSISRLAQLSRAAGIHLILATQRPSVDVIRGTIKANFVNRIAFKVSSKADSQTILDTNGAEQLLGKGDMLFKSATNDSLIRIQNAFISADEVSKVVNFIKRQKGFKTPYYLPSVKSKENINGNPSRSGLDELIGQAGELVINSGTASVTFLQRRLRIGYARAARIMDELEELGVVGPMDSSKNRLVLIDNVETFNEILENYNINN